MEVFKMLPGGTRAKVIKKTLCVSLAPSTNRQRIALKLASRLLAFAEEHRTGDVFVSPTDVFLDEHSAVSSPILFSLLAKRENILGSGIHGLPDLLIESVISGK